MARKRVDGQEIARRMVRADIDQKRMADLAGCSESMMSYVVRGMREPSVSMLALIADALGCKVDDLLTE